MTCVAVFASATLFAALSIPAAGQVDGATAAAECWSAGTCAANDTDQVAALQLAAGSFRTEEKPPKCKGDLKYTTCGTACERICGKPVPDNCPAVCVDGCQCPRGKWRIGNKCYDQCPDEKPPKCKGDLKYTTCGTACERICGKPVPNNCPDVCVGGCQCPSGKWRVGNKCYDQCPDDKPPKCKGDLEYTTCGTACERICGKPDPEICIDLCVEGCQCPRGKWRVRNKCYNRCPSTQLCPQPQSDQQVCKKKCTLPVCPRGKCAARKGPCCRFKCERPLTLNGKTLLATASVLPASAVPVSDARVASVSA